MLASGCGSGVTVNYDYDQGYDFTDLQTYAWMPVRVAVEIGELKANRLVAAFDDQLATMGMKKVEENPDFMINLHGSSQQKVDITDWGYSYGGYWGGGVRDVDVMTYEEGTLIVDFVDGESKELFWRGTAVGVVEPDRSPEQQEARFQNLAAQVLSRFPPRG
jgi:hypothetical protein